MSIAWLQDIINAVISRKPEIVYKLPCEWNLQMGYQSRQNLCPARISDLKVKLSIVDETSW